MKQGWEIKKLGEVCNLYQPRTISGEMLVEDGKYLVYGANGIIGRYNEYNHERSEVLLTCRGATCGTINVSEPYSWINGNAMVVQPKNDNIGKIYLQYLLQAVDWGKVITGAAQPQITRQSLSPLDVIIPPKEEQERIVKELDCLSGVIEKKKQQLKELDALAQSIFYQMFGDPISNEKGWEVKKLGEVCNKITDGTHNSPKSFPSGVYMYVTAKNIKKDGFDLSNITYVPEDVHKSIYSRCNPVLGDILYIKDGATTGIAMINSLKEEFSLLSSVALLKCNYDMVSNIFIKEVLNSTSKYNEIRGNMGGAAITRLTINKIENIYIPLPPITLQQEFAEKIEAIEKQKEIIKQSIKETETLFNSRMNYYFN